MYVALPDEALLATGDLKLIRAVAREWAPNVQLIHSMATLARTTLKDVPATLRAAGEERQDPYGQSYWVLDPEPAAKLLTEALASANLNPESILHDYVPTS